MAQWVLDHSVAVLQDETGLRLDHFYDAASRKRHTTSWLTRHAGLFPGFAKRERAWYASEVENLSNTFSGPQLPFRFGYGTADQNGTLLAAWHEGCP